MISTDRSDDRFHTPRASARAGGYSSSNSGDDTFTTPRTATARSHLSDEFETPREVWISDGSPQHVENSPHAYRNAFSHVSGIPLYRRCPDSAEEKYRSGEDFCNNDLVGCSEIAYTIDMEEKNSGYDINHHPCSEGVESSRLEDPTEAVGIVDTDIDDIFSFARHNRHKELEELLKKGVPVDVRDQHGNTILSVACQNGLKRIAKTALRYGADLNSRNLKGNTPLHFCHKYGYGGSLGVYLISKGADPTIGNQSGVTYTQLEERQRIQPQ